MKVTATTMQVRVYNDNINGAGKAVGQWYINIAATDAVITESGTTASGSNKLVAIDHETGNKADVMDLTHAYDSLASTDGVEFFAYSGQDLYKIDTDAGTETLVGTTTDGSDFTGLEFAGTAPIAYDAGDTTVIPINKVSAESFVAPVSLGDLTDLGTIVFMDIDEDPDGGSDGFD